MDIYQFLQWTMKLASPPKPVEVDSILQWLTASLSELNLDIEVVPVSTSDSTHRYLRLTGRQYIIWDEALNGTIANILIASQLGRLANSWPGDATARDIRTLASNYLRQVLFIYIARKLRRFPHTSAAFYWLASDVGTLDQNVPIIEREATQDIYRIQLMLMFYHEVAHAYFHEHQDRFDETASKTRHLLEAVKDSWTEGLLLGDIAHYPEFSSLTPSGRFDHYVEELACDHQAFVLTCMALPAAPFISPRSWQDSLGFAFGASSTLALIERSLKMASAKWSEFAEATGDGTGATPDSLELPSYLENRRLFYIRRWNTITALQPVLKHISSTLGEDAFSWQEYIIEKFSGLNEALEEQLVSELNGTANLEFLGRVLARAQIHRETHP
jgi:hypothetical protein